MQQNNNIQISASKSDNSDLITSISQIKHSDSSSNQTETKELKITSNISQFSDIHQEKQYQNNDNNQQHKKETIDYQQNANQSEIQNKGILIKLKEIFRILIIENWKQLIVGLVLGLLYHFTGLNVITFYLPEILANAGVQNRTTLLLLTLAIGVWNSITSIPQLFFINRVGRRMVLLVGSIVQLFGMFLLMLSTLLPVLVKNEKSYYMAIPGIIIFFAGFEIGIGPVFLVMIAEMFPEKITSATSCFLMTVMWIANLTIVTIYSPLSNSIGDSGVFIITFVLTFILVVFTIIVVKETKGMYPRTNKAICQEENVDIS